MARVICSLKSSTLDFFHFGDQIWWSLTSSTFGWYLVFSIVYLIKKKKKKGKALVAQKCQALQMLHEVLFHWRFSPKTQWDWSCQVRTSDSLSCWVAPVSPQELPWAVRISCSFLRGLQGHPWGMFYFITRSIEWLYLNTGPNITSF